MKPTKEQIEQWHNDSNNWKFGGIYYNPEDPRGLVNKRIEWMGWTMNFANRKGILLFLLLTAIIIVAMVFVPMTPKA